MPLDDTSAYNHREGRSTSLTFRLDEGTVKKLRDEAQRQGISLNSFVNQALKNYLEWHIFESKVGFVPIVKPVVEELFAALSEEQINKIAANSGKQEFENSVYFMKGKIDLDSFLSWFEARMKYSSIQVSHTFDVNSRMHTYVIKHDISEKWALYLKQLIEYIFNKVLEKKVEVTTSHTTLTFKFRQD